MLTAPLLAFAFACHHRAAVEEPGGEPSGEPPFVGWSPDGARLHTAPPGVLSPSGARWARRSGASVLWGTTDGHGPHGLIPIERWLSGEDEALPDTLFAWIDDEQLYLHQLDVYLAYTSQDEPFLAEACRVYNVLTEAMTTPEACVHGDFVELHGVQFSGGLVIAESHGEGHPSLDVFRWTSDKGQGDRAIPPLDLYPFGPVVPHFTAAGVALMTPCHLGEERPCQAKDGEDRGDEPWRHYVVKDDTFVLLREGLPADAQPHPQDADRYLWAEGDRVCEGDPAGKRRCR